MREVTAGVVASSASMREVWSHRVLRQLSEPACIEACDGNRASDHC